MIKSLCTRIYIYIYIRSFSPIWSSRGGFYALGFYICWIGLFFFRLLLQNWFRSLFNTNKIFQYPVAVAVPRRIYAWRWYIFWQNSVPSESDRQANKTTKSICYFFFVVEATHAKVYRLYRVCVCVFCYICYACTMTNAFPFRMHH